MLGFSLGEKVRVVLRLNETAGAACDSSGRERASSSAPRANAVVVSLLTLLRGECSTGTPQENSNSPATVASARRDYAAGLPSKRGASRPLPHEWVRCDTRPRPISLP